MWVRWVLHALLLLLLDALLLLLLLLYRLLRDQRRRVGEDVHSLPPLDDCSLHGHWSMYVMQFEVQSASITNGVSATVSTPQRCCSCPAICTNQILTPSLLLSSAGTHRARLSAIGFARSISWAWLALLFLLVCYGCCRCWLCFFCILFRGV